MSDYNKGFELAAKLQAEIDKRDTLIMCLKRQLMDAQTRIDADHQRIMSMPAPTLDARS